MAQGQEVEEVLVRDEGQGPLHIQGFRGKEGAYTVYSTILDSLTILNIELLHAVLLKAFEVF